MFDTFFGLPTHAIIVHAVVIFVPLTALAATALTAVPRWRTRYGVLAALAALTSIGSVFIAQESGEILEDRVLRTEGAPLEWYSSTPRSVRTCCPGCSSCRSRCWG